VIKSEVFTRVPDRLRARQNARMQSGVARDCFLDGPSFDRAGNLYVTNVPYGQIFRVSPQGPTARRSLSPRARPARSCWRGSKSPARPCIRIRE
jgi:sugar lactone lactonase YvrE